MTWLPILLQISSIIAGEKIFALNCSVGYCHGAAGAAARGPRLRGRTFDKNYLYSIIRDGIPKSAMPAWKDRLKEDELWATVAYVQSLATAPADAAPVVTAGPAPNGETFAGPAAVARGRDLFAGSNGCASCHTLGGRGVGVGPDVTKVPKGQLIAAIQSTRSRHVRTVKLKDGESFPGIMGAEDSGFVQAFDLTAAPPVRRTLEKTEIDSLTPGDWSHQSVASGYSKEQLADIVEYISWTSQGGAGW
jgi:putative heme-binding domain-containing protein